MTRYLALLVVAAATLPAAVSWTYGASGPPERNEVASNCTSDGVTASTWPAADGVLDVQATVQDRDGSTWLGGQEERSRAWVAKLDTAGCLMFAVRIRSASGYSGVATSLAVDSAGRVWVGGSAPADDLPVRTSFTGTFALGRKGRGFLLRLSPDGSQLLWSNYIDGAVTALSVDSSDNLYIGGVTDVHGYPDTLKLSSGQLSAAGNPSIFGAFLLKVNPAGSQVLLGGVLTGNQFLCSGGSGCDFAARSTNLVGLAIDAENNVVIAGNSNVRDLPQNASPGPFVAKIRQGESPGLLWIRSLSKAVEGLAPRLQAASTASALALTPTGEVIVAGTTSDAAFPATQSTIQPGFSGSSSTFGILRDGFLTKLNAAGSIVWSTFVGVADSSENITSAAVDEAGTIWATVGAGTSQHRLVRVTADASRVLFSEERQGYRFPELPSRLHSSVISLASPEGVVRTLRLTEAGPRDRRIAAVVSSANHVPSAAVAPGQLITLYGPGIGESSPELRIAGVAAPVLYARANQINAIVPSQLAPGAPALIELQRAAAPPLAIPVDAVAASPDLFRHADGSVVALNEDGTVHSANNPAAPGSIVTLFATGAGGDPRPAGTIADGPRSRDCCRVYEVGPNLALTLELQVLYAGDAPGLVTALTQINVRLPERQSPIRVSLEGSFSDALIHVK